MNLTDRSAVIETLLPDDPEDGYIFTLPEGQTVGGANVIYMYKGGKRIGTVQQLSAVNNVSGKHVLDRTITNTELKKGDVIQVIGVQYSFTRVRFVQYYGWIGDTDYSEKSGICIHDKHYKVMDVSGVGFQTEGHNVYEKVCLETIQKEK